ncbi:MFS transporter [Methanobacterium subterraneum]|jgi:EmrB/QacA subfamily drug resistance transporter|uniref:MFS transporter n=1 Tax=Methanobacterium subterraneum TaxID=59277 RepID=A0A2H4VP48_9EURY|nr:MFS transporter [Methanobacterium subterraneum]AUB59846.1 MFS transporter [Methanobacterium subterraneum]NMO09117.1 MFS transporter [Methanobacterium subterraneum]
MVNQGQNRILILLFVGVFMGSLDIGIVGPALPSIQSYFTVNERLLSWVFTIYILFFMLGTPLMAKLSDIYGRKAIYILDILLFTIGSVVTITSFSFEMLLLGRAIQGLGAGGIFPVANAFIGDIFPPDKRGGALGILSSVWGWSSVLGPILGGLLLHYGWQWLFIINLPITMAVIVGSLYILPCSERNHKITFDWQGLMVLGFLVTSLAYGINQINTNNITSSLLSWDVLPYLILSVIMVPILWNVEKKAQNPLIQVDLLKSREVKLVNSIMVGTGLVQASTVFIPAFVIVALAFSSRQASLMLVPLVLTMALGAPLIGRLLDKFGSRNIMLIGSLAMAVGLFTVALFSEKFYIVIAASILIGVGMSTTIGSPPRYIMLVESPPQDRASGQALLNIITSVGQLVGGALVGAFIGSYAGELLGYQYAYLFIGLVALIMTILAIGLKSKEEQIKTSY